MKCIPEGILVDALELKKFDLENMTIIRHLILFHTWIGHLEFKEDIKKQILKGLRFH